MASTAQIANLAFSTISSYQTAKAQKDAYNYQAQVERNNAVLADRRAKDALERGAAEEQRQRLKTAQLKSTQRAALAARGIDLGEGSALDILTSTDYMGEVDARTIHDNAAQEAWGIRVQRDSILDNARLLSDRAGSIRPGVTAMGTFLGGATRVAASWYTPAPSTATSSYSAKTSTKYSGWGA